jgi:hypothetical protein
LVLGNKVSNYLILLSYSIFGHFSYPLANPYHLRASVSSSQAPMNSAASEKNSAPKPIAATMTYSMLFAG